MKTRLRFAAALLALLALSTSVVEQAWAATCVLASGATAMVVPVPQGGAGLGGQAGHAGHPESGRESSAPDEHRDHRSSDPASCPMGAAAGIACGAAALPADQLSAAIPADARAGVAAAPDQAPRSLALSSLFRPPRR